MDHPRSVERPSNTTVEKKRRTEVQAERKRELAFKSHVHDFMQGGMVRENAELIASDLTGYKPKQD